MPVQNFEDLIQQPTMNVEAIQTKMEKYWETATPEQVVKEFEDLGVEFVDIEPELNIDYGFTPVEEHGDLKNVIGNLKNKFIQEVEEAIENDPTVVTEPLFPDYLLNDPQIVGYPDLETQKEIYKWVFNKLPKNNFSIKDFGAGRGDFFNFIDWNFDYSESDEIEIDYFGIELNPNLVNVAKHKYPDIQMFNNDYLDVSIESDYTVVIGTLNESRDLDKWENFNKTLNHAINTTKHSVLFVLQANTYGIEGYVDFPIHELVQWLPPNTKFTIDNSKIEDIYILVVHIAD